MLLLLRFVLVLLGVTYIVTQSSIFILPRMWIAAKSTMLGLLIYCPACTGFWVGLALGFLGGWPMPTLLGPLDPALVACGLMATWTMAFVRVSSWENEQNASPQEEKD